MAQPCLNQERFPDLIENRTCKICNETKDLVKDFQYHSSSGFFSRTCTYCINKKRRQQYEEEIVREGGTLDRNHTLEKRKTCLKCNEEKPIEQFTKRGRVYTIICKSCANSILNPKKKLSYNGDIIHKICNICKVEKAHDKFSKYLNRYGRVSLKYCCKECEVKKWKGGSKITELFNRYRRFDLGKNLEFSLTTKFIEEILKQPCTYCAFPSTGLDRIDNNIGHIENNCVPCCWECNTARMNNFSYEEMKEIGEVIRKIKLKRISLN